ncbi:MAG: guanylate kinase [Gemmataceae bacterium]|nr:guanylate kinase [Gemmataceae bacterium]
MIGPLIILSGPSGSGKSTVIDRVLKHTDSLRLSVSATTRPRRDREVDGVNYHFWTRERFEQERQADGFLEWAEVYGNYYGTLRSEVEPFRAKGIGVILDVDVQGAAAVRRKCPDNVSIFLRPTSLAVLEERLRKRGSETEETLMRRLAAAQRELDRAGEYDFQVINDDLDSTVSELQGFVDVTFRGKNMLDELKEEGIVNKVGGRFKLSTLIQKRMVALNTGAKPLVNMASTDKMAIVIQEILQDKIYLDMSGTVQTREGSLSDAARGAMLMDSSGD